MNNTTELKTRIKIIKQTRQITKAMHLISSAKMKRAMARYNSNLPYFQRVHSVLKEILEHSGNLQHRYFLPGTAERTAYLVIGSDRGLAGGYSQNLNNFAWEHMQGRNVVRLIAIGSLTAGFFLRKQQSIDKTFMHLSQDPSLHNSRLIAAYLLDLFNRGIADEIYLVYTDFVSAALQKNKAEKLLPLGLDMFGDVEASGKLQSDLEYFPSKDNVLEKLVPEYLIGAVYGALVHSFTSEQSARMNAMDSATRNADELVNSLTLQYNRARQWGITEEIIEISAGAEAHAEGSREHGSTANR
ncbi:MAG: ATP synthase F1 subunit gamma [Firmicutes bacterium]|nr:ATP synthase F1 subunit gamma [Bacillota bacterium]